MKLFPVAIAIFYRWLPTQKLEVWVQKRVDDGPFHGLLEFPGGGVEAHEVPLQAVVREVDEEVGILVDPGLATQMGIYPNEMPNRTVLLYVFLFPEHSELNTKGQWLEIEQTQLSAPYKGQIPGPNHLIIDDLFRHLYDNQHE